MPYDNADKHMQKQRCVFLTELLTLVALVRDFKTTAMQFTPQFTCDRTYKMPGYTYKL